MTSHDGITRTVHLGLGANLGDRVATLRSAIDALATHPELNLDSGEDVAGLFESPPMGGPSGQPMFLNTVVALRTALPAHELLAVTQGVEARLGRVREHRWGPRTLDIDVLLVGDTVVADPVLVLPHPQLHRRLFVLEPLAEVAGNLVHPTLGESVAVLARTAREAYPWTGAVPVCGVDWVTAPLAGAIA